VVRCMAIQYMARWMVWIGQLYLQATIR